MKILYIANIRLPTEKAHGLQIMKTCEAFAEAGHNLELVIPTRRNILREDPFSYYQVHSMFRITSLQVPDFVSFGKIGFIVSLLIFSERARLLKSFRSADIIYSRDALVLLQYILLGRRFVFEAHGKPTLVARLVARHAYRVVVISKALGATYQEIGVPHEKIIIAPDAVDAHMFDDAPLRDGARASLGFMSDAKTVVYTGHLYVRKGVETLAQAAALTPEAQFFFVGGTAGDIAQFRAQWGSQPNIHIIGHVPPTQVPQYLRAADILVIPNSGKDEDAREFTSPMKLFEYMASGTSIVASSVPATREILADDCAYFFTPDDPHALAESIKIALAHTKESGEKAHRAVAKSKEYTWTKRIERILVAIQ